VVVRQHANLPFTEKTPFGEASGGASEQLVDIGGREYRRLRVTLDKPARDGDNTLHILSDSPPDTPAGKIAELYRKRWAIETAFQRIEKYLNSEIETLAYPKAALFGFASALAAYNVFSVIMAALESAHGKPLSEEISGYYSGFNIK